MEKKKDQERTEKVCEERRDVSVWHFMINSSDQQRSEGLAARPCATATRWGRVCDQPFASLLVGTVEMHCKAARAQRFFHPELFLGCRGRVGLAFGGVDPWYRLTEGCTLVFGVNWWLSGRHGSMWSAIVTVALYYICTVISRRQGPRLRPGFRPRRRRPRRHLRRHVHRRVPLRPCLGYWHHDQPPAG